MVARLLASTAALAVLVAALPNMGHAQRSPERSLASVKGRSESPLERPALLTVAGLPLGRALEELHKRSGVDLLFSPSLIPPGQRASCDCAEVTVAHALERLLAGTPLQYVEVAGQVVIIDANDVGRTRPSLPVRTTDFLSRNVDLAVLPAGRLIALQAGEIAGVVQDTRARPVTGARVTVVGSANQAVTDQEGRFRLGNLSGAEVSLSVTAIGFRPLTQSARVGDRALRLALTEMAVNLDELVVTGTAGAVQKRALGHSVGRIDVAEVSEVAPIQDVGQLLNGRTPGVIINQGTGAAGGGNRILIRGVSTLAFNGNPLVYVDGVRVNNDVNRSVPGANTAWDAAISRLNDFNPADIESIEIIKGPAAATLYGTEASNGVIQIITKKGRAGRTELGMRFRQGGTKLFNPEDRFPRTYARNAATGAIDSLSIVETEAARGTPLFRTGHIQGYGIDVGGGAGSLQYRVAANVDRDEGIVPSNAVTRFSGNANLAFAPHPTVSATASLGLTTSDGSFYADTYGFNVFNTSGAVEYAQSRLSAVPTGSGAGDPPLYAGR